MKLLTLLLFCATIMLAQDVQTPVNPVVDGERVILIKGRVAGDMRVWLVVECHNGADGWKHDGYNPSYSRVIVDYRPLFRKLPSGQYEIMFTSELAKDLP